MSDHYKYVLYEFDKISERLERRIELEHCDPLVVREQLAPDESEPPYIFDTFPVFSYHQALIFDQNLANAQLDFSNKAYFLEANPRR